MDLKIELAAFEGRLACLRAAARWQVSRDERRLILEPGGRLLRGIGSEQDGAVLPKQPVEEGPRRPRHEVKPAEGRSGRSSGPSGHKQPSAQWRRQLMRST